MGEMCNEGPPFFTSASGKYKTLETFGIKIQSATRMAFLCLWFYTGLSF